MENKETFERRLWLNRKLFPIHDGENRIPQPWFVASFLVTTACEDFQNKMADNRITLCKLWRLMTTCHNSEKQMNFQMYKSTRGNADKEREGGGWFPGSFEANYPRSLHLYLPHTAYLLKEDSGQGDRSEWKAGNTLEIELGSKSPPIMKICSLSHTHCAFGLQLYHCSPCATLQISLVKFFHPLRSFARCLKILRS